MGVFKEPQPRGGGQKAASVRMEPQMMPANSRPSAPIRDSPSTLDVTIRSAALQAAAVLQGTMPSSAFWANIIALEDYLRTGKTL